MAATVSRQKLLARWEQLKNERQSWEPHWKEISENVLPRAGRFLTSDRNQGGKKHHNIYDSTGTRALRVLAAGLMAGMTSPSRPWFRLTTNSPDLDEAQAVKQWLADVTRTMQMVFSRSNTYRVLHTMYEELGSFGTAACIVVEDFDTVIHCHALTAGEYAIATDYRGKVTTLYRELEMTVSQLVKEFGYDACSSRVRGMFDTGKLEAWIKIMQAIEPRSDRDASKKDAKNMEWSSIYFEMASDKDGVLREGGYKSFPALAPRWAVSGGDIYGNSPAMEALGDIKQLQHEQLRKAQGIDYKTKPPLQMPTSMKHDEIDLLPGGLSYVDIAQAGGGIRSAFEVNLDLSHLLADIQDVRERIKGGFYADLFLMLANGSNPAMTATEVAERHEEKLLMLGPVLERLHNEVLDPLIEMTFERMLEAGILPPPPEELQGSELNVEFVSMLAQAQRAVSTNSIDRFVANLGNVAQLKPEVLDKLDADKWADAYAEALGLDPELIVPGDKVAAMREQRAQAQQQAQQAQMMQQGADMAQTLGSIKTNEPSALTDMAQAMGGEPA